jgi:hypothetical protein
MRYPASVAITWETTFAELPEPEQGLLQVVAWLAPEPIRLFFIDAEPLTVAIPEPREALAGLAAFSLAGFETESDAVVIHRLVQDDARRRGDETGREASLRTALDAVNVLATGNPQDVRSWPVWTPLAADVASVASHADAAVIEEPTARLIGDLGIYQQSWGRLREAEPLMRRALAIDEQSYGRVNPSVAIHLNNLVQLLKATNRMAEAEPLSRRQLEIFLAFTRSTGHEHPHLRKAIRNYSRLLAAMRRRREEIDADVETLCRPYGVSPI